MLCAFPTSKLEGGDSVRFVIVINDASTLLQYSNLNLIVFAGKAWGHASYSKTNVIN